MGQKPFCWGGVFLRLATSGCSVRERNPKRPEQLQKLLLNKEAVAWHTQRTPESTPEAKGTGEWKRRGGKDLEEMVRSDKVRGVEGGEMSRWKVLLEEKERR